MREEWQYQIRFKLDEKRSEIVRSNPDDPAFKQIADVLARHKATARSQYDAFADYVSQAEKEGIEHYPLYKWTKAMIEDPAKRAKHSTSFAVLVDGAPVYSKATADALEADLGPLADLGLIVSLSRLAGHVVEWLILAQRRQTRDGIKIEKKEFADWLKCLLSQVWVRRGSMHIVRGFSEGASQRSDQCYRAGRPESISRLHCALLKESSKLSRFCWDSKQNPREAYRGLRSSSTCALTSYYQTPILPLVV